MGNRRKHPPIRESDVFGKLTVIGEAGNDGSHRVLLCRCECGGETRTRETSLRNKVRSCGKCTSGRPIKDDGIDRGYERQHARVRKALGAAGDHKCIDCDLGADQWSYVGPCVSEKRNEAGKMAYCEHIEHYQPRCRDCHGVLDAAKEVTVRQIRARAITHL